MASISSLGTSGFKALKFEQSDYLKGLPDSQHQPIIERAHAQLSQLGVDEKFSHVYLLGQLRCLGIYFSPVNFYFLVIKIMNLVTWWLR